MKPGCQVEREPKVAIGSEHESLAQMTGSEESGRLTRLFLMSAGWIFLLTAAIKFMSAMQEVRVLGRPDPLLEFLTTRQLLALTALLEAGVAAVILWAGRAVAASEKLLLVFWLSTIFLLYRLGLWWIGHQGGCNCMGNAAQWLGTSPEKLNSIATVLLAYLVVGSSGLLVWKAMLFGRKASALGQRHSAGLVERKVRYSRDGSLPMWTMTLHKQSTLLKLALVVVGPALYLRAVRFEFLNFDDPFYVTQNPIVQQGLTIDGIKWAVTSTSGLYHPLAWLSLMSDIELFGVNSAALHLTNVWIHTLNGILLFAFLNSRTQAVWPSAFTACIFLIHPTNVESVAWISERKGLLCTSFFLLALLAYAQYVERPTVRRYCVVIASFLGSIAAKPSVTFFPFLLLVFDCYLFKRICSRWVRSCEGGIPLRSLRFLILEKLPFISICALFSLLTIKAERNAYLVQEHLFTVVDLAYGLRSYAEYTALLLWPNDHSVYRVYPDEAGVSRVLLGGAVLCMLLVISVRAPLPVMCRIGILWYIASLVPVAGIIRVGEHWIADRYLYIPGIGYGMALVWGFYCIGTHHKAPLTLLASGALLYVIGLGTLTCDALGQWKSSETLFLREVARCPNNWLAHNNLGVALAARGQLDSAMLHFSRAVELRSAHMPARVNMIIALMRRGYFDNAYIVTLDSMSVAFRDPLEHDAIRALFEAQLTE
jgi:protein O-mannosyl-transferase